MTNSDSQEHPTSRRRKGATTQAEAGVNGAHASKRADVAQADAQSSDDDQPFEASLAQLDEIVATLEDGRLPLDDALALFERGVQLARRCQAQLDNAELRVERLRAAGGLADLSAADATYALDDFDEDDE